MRYKQTGGYAKDELLEQPSAHETDDITYEERNNPKKSMSDETTYSNPIYDSTILGPDEIDMTGYETKPAIPATDDSEPLDSFHAVLHDYQTPEEIIKLPLDADLDTKEAVEDPDQGLKPALYEYERL